MFWFRSGVDIRWFLFVLGVMYVWGSRLGRGVEEFGVGDRMGGVWGGVEDGDGIWVESAAGEWMIIMRVSRVV